MNSKKISIAIDGPAGSGKSTIAKEVALKFGYTYIDTGAMYRAITFKALRENICLTDEQQLTQLANHISIVLVYEPLIDGTQLHVIMDGSDVSEEIRSIEVTNNVSVVAAVSGVREAMVLLQQKMALTGGVVMDGRDIGTVVLPQAELKIFLTASVTERSKRRWLELKEKGIMVELQELEEQIRQRDYLDSHREISPLCQAKQAILLDTTSLTIDQVVTKVIELACTKGAQFDNYLMNKYR
ncbi:MAG TPA: (d)CMP kinase [Firmicutes bacterium]|jgi:CMP/dCMP kinase|nr:(d)CMP kinase [Bacillota bacterium]